MRYVIIIFACLAFTAPAFGQCRGDSCRVRILPRVAVKVERSVLVNRVRPAIIREVHRTIHRRVLFPRLRARLRR